MALQVDPEEIIQFKGPGSEVVNTDVTLSNRSQDQLAFKVKTTAPRRYAVRPNSGSLNPGESITVSVMRQPFEMDPNERVRHKFMIQSVKVLPEQNLSTIWSDADPSLFMETKLKVQFDDIPLPQSNRTSMVDEEFQRVVSDNRRLSKEVDTLQAQKAQLEARMMSCSEVPLKPKSAFQEFLTVKNVLIVLALLVAFFIGGLVVADTVLLPDEL